MPSSLLHLPFLQSLIRWFDACHPKDASSVRCFGPGHTTGKHSSQGSQSSSATSQAAVGCPSIYAQHTNGSHRYARGRATECLQPAPGSSAPCIESAKHCADRPCSTSSRRRRSDVGPRQLHGRKLYRHSGADEKRKDGLGACRTDLKLFPSISTAVVEEVEPKHTGPEDAGGDEKRAAVPPFVLGEARVQGPEVLGPCPMDAGICSRCGRPRRLPHDEGAPHLSSGGHRTVLYRRRRLGACFSTQPSSVFQERHQVVAMHQRSFGGLVHPQWSTDLKKQRQKADVEEEEEETGSPRRRPRYPKKPNAKAKAEGS